MPRNTVLCAAIAVALSGCPARQTQPVDPASQPSAETGSASLGDATAQPAEQARHEPFVEPEIPEHLIADQCRTVAQALKHARADSHLAMVAHAFEGGPCTRLMSVQEVTPDVLLQALAKAQREVPRFCKPLCEEVWDALAMAAPELKRFFVADYCADEYDYDLQRFTIELQLAYLALRRCHRYQDAFEGVVIFGGHSLSYSPPGNEIRNITDLKPGMFAFPFGELTPWADVVKTVSPDGVRVAWPNLLTVRGGEIAWLDEEAGYRFPGKNSTVEAARKELSEHIELERFDPPLLAVGTGTSLEQLKQALDPSARLTDAPGPVISEAKCPEGAPTIRPAGPEDYEIRGHGFSDIPVRRYDIAYKLEGKPAACLEGFQDYAALRDLARTIPAATADDSGPDLVIHLE